MIANEIAGVSTGYTLRKRVLFGRLIASSLYFLSLIILIAIAASPYWFQIQISPFPNASSDTIAHTGLFYSCYPKRINSTSSFDSECFRVSDSYLNEQLTYCSNSKETHPEATDQDVRLCTSEIHETRVARGFLVITILILSFLFTLSLYEALLPLQTIHNLIKKFRPNIIPVACIISRICLVFGLLATSTHIITTVMSWSIYQNYYKISDLHTNSLYYPHDSQLQYGVAFRLCLAFNIINGIAFLFALVFNRPKKIEFYLRKAITSLNSEGEINLSTNTSNTQNSYSQVL